MHASDVHGSLHAVVCVLRLHVPFPWSAPIAYEHKRPGASSLHMCPRPFTHPLTCCCRLQASMVALSQLGGLPSVEDRLLTVQDLEGRLAALEEQAALYQARWVI